MFNKLGGWFGCLPFFIYLWCMKTFKDFFNNKQRYTDIVDGEGNVIRKGDVMSNNNPTTRTTLDTLYKGGELELNIEKFEYTECGYSKIKQYRRLQGGYRPQQVIRYRYTYTEGRKRLTSKDFKSLRDLIIDMRQKTSEVKMGVNTTEVIETDNQLLIR